MVSTRFLSFGVQGRLKFLSSFSFMVSLKFHFVYINTICIRKKELQAYFLPYKLTHIEILPVLVSDKSSKFVSQF